MNRFLHIQLLLIAIVISCADCFGVRHSIVPAPAEYSSHRGSFKIPADGLSTLFISPASNIDHELTERWLNDAGIAVAAADSSAASVSLLLKPGLTGNEEGYAIEISPERITIAADSDNGLIWGLQTMRQLKDSRGKLPCCTIKDYPAYPWRSYLLDESRHFFGKESTERLIDELSRIKINILHWHLTDGAGWRIEIPDYPLLTEIGAKMDYSHRGITPSQWDSIHPAPAYYNADDVKEIVNYARRRGIKVIPEIDMPGHSLAAITAYPWLGTSSRLAGRPVIGDVLQVTDPEVEQFMQNTLSYLIDLFETDIIHIGGDEVDFSHWENARGVRAFMAEKGIDEPWQLQQWFVDRMTRFLNRKGCRVIGWNEITGRADDKATVEGTITQFWEGDTSKISRAVKQGYKVVNSAQLFTYLDYSYEGTPLWKTYRHKPSENGDNTDIIGFGAQMWTENVPDFTRLCYMTFPRIAALAECGWTLPSNKNYPDFIRRVAPLQRLWLATGILNGQPYYTPREPNAILPLKYRPK